MQWLDRHRCRPLIGGIALMVLVGVTLVAWRGLKQPVLPRAESLPTTARDRGYVSSDVCRACHPQEYASWHVTYHRTMTQIATPETVLAPFDSITLEAQGRPYRLERRGNTFWIELDDPDWPPQRLVAPLWNASQRFQLVENPAATPPRVERRVVMVTGSHHQQRYWLASGKGNRLDLLPFAYLIAEKRWVPSPAIFLRPHAEQDVKKGAWNTICVACHSVGGQPRHTQQATDTRVGELGIACEACHGPAAEHVQANRNPQRRYRLHLSDQSDSTIVQPQRLSAKRSSEICGQCHSVYVFHNWKAWAKHGSSYRPGGDLEQDRRIVRYTDTATEPWLKRWLSGSPTKMAQRFWPDGTIRVSGREFNGLIESGCYQRGELSCLSCHAMHDSDPKAQLRAGMESDAACLSCHQAYQARLQTHTHHAPDSVGSRCYNCHMPYTTHGLLRAMRSHRIDSPSAVVSASTGRPNACNLCHLDKSLAWTANFLTAWYHHPEVDLSEDEASTSAALLWLLRGDAVQRAVTAWNMGWVPAHDASGHQWQAPFLAELLTDPYAAVRFNAHRSLRQLPGFADFAYDYVGTLAARERARERARKQWEQLSAMPLEQTGRQVLITPDGHIQQDRLTHIIRQRDDRPMRIAE